MKRRDAIKFTALSLGALLGKPYSHSVLEKTIHLFQGDIRLLQPKYFNTQQFEILETVIDVIIPETDSPSASQVGVSYLMDSIVAEVMNDDERSGFMTNFNAMESYLNQKTFIHLPDDQKTKLLFSILNGDAGIRDEILWGVQTLRGFSIDIYLLTEEIAEKHLNYVPVPGKYDACINVSDANNTRWAI